MRFKGRQPFQNSALLSATDISQFQHILIATYPRSPHRLPTKTVRLSALLDSSNLAHRFRCRNPFSERAGGVEARYPVDLVGDEDGMIQSPCHIGVTQQCYPIISLAKEIMRVPYCKFTSILLSPPQSSASTS